MKCFIIAIGGTGQRVARSIVHTVAADCKIKNDELVPMFKSVDEFRIMVVDSDATNRDGVVFSNTIKAYEYLHSRNIFDKRVNLYKWSPIKNAASNMAEILNYPNMDDETKSIFDFLYTPTEKRVPLKEGFYGHTAIGSYFMHDNIITNDNPPRFEDSDNDNTTGWKSFFKDVDSSVDKILIIGSTYGGTGASGVPTISKILRKVESTKDAQIGVVLVQPYINPTKPMKSDTDDDRDVDIEITGEYHYPQSRMIFEYYINQELGNIINDLYIIGEDPSKMMSVKNSKGGANQNNKANAIELFAASALVDFIATPIREGTERFKVKSTWRDNDLKLSASVLNRAGIPVLVNPAMKYRVVKFFTFSIILTSFFSHRIHRSLEKKAVVGDVYKSYNFTDDANIQGGDPNNSVISVMNNFCKLFADWLREMVITTDDFGNWDIDKPIANNLIQWITPCAVSLYDYERASAKTDSNDKIVAASLDKYIDNENPGFNSIIKSKFKSLKAETIWAEMNHTGFKPRKPGTVAHFIDDLVKLIMKNVQEG